MKRAGSEDNSKYFQDANLSISVNVQARVYISSSTGNCETKVQIVFQNKSISYYGVGVFYNLVHFFS